MRRIPETEIIGKKFGRLTPQMEVEMHIEPSGRKSRRFLCLCDCGNTSEVPLGDIRRGNTTSCGCIHRKNLRSRNTTHGLYGTPEHSSWKSMKQRCLNEKVPNYKDYGARGITVCKRWRDSFNNFLEDMGHRPEGTSLDRIYNNGNYEPTNCRWATRAEQQRNQRSNITFNGECAADASRRIGGCESLVANRIAMGWSFEKAFTNKLQ